eukprot:109456-Alexandrium_andersonii.AAC.1
MCTRTLGASKHVGALAFTLLPLHPSMPAAQKVCASPVSGARGARCLTDPCGHGPGNNKALGGHAAVRARLNSSPKAFENALSFLRLPVSLASCALLTFFPRAAALMTTM